MAMGGIPSGGGGRRRSRAPMAEINVTPMVDVMLVLLIIFMVTAPLLMSGVPVNLPDSRAKALEQPKKPVQISIDAKGGTYVDDQPVDDAALAAKLDQIAVRSPPGDPTQIFLRADRAVDYGKVMRVMGELNNAGLNKVSLVSVAEQGGG
ncbi:protein TolR [Sphingomonas sp.]|uniref:protein TolR n=1 Tax=Sphingomonas sp. TaxID=28214 RepID=UPI003B002ABD